MWIYLVNEKYVNVEIYCKKKMYMNKKKSRMLQKMNVEIMRKNVKKNIKCSKQITIKNNNNNFHGRFNKSRGRLGGCSIFATTINVNVL